MGKRRSSSPNIDSKNYTIDRDNSASPNSIINCYNKNHVLEGQQLLHKKTASEAVMEKLRNNILKHGEDKINSGITDADISSKHSKLVNGIHYHNYHGPKLNGQRSNGESAFTESGTKKPIKSNNNNNLDLSNESNIIKVNNGDENNVHYTNDAESVKAASVPQQNQEVPTVTKSTASTASSATASSGSLTAVA